MQIWCNFVTLEKTPVFPKLGADQFTKKWIIMWYCVYSNFYKYHFFSRYHLRLTAVVVSCVWLMKSNSPTVLILLCLRCLYLVTDEFTKINLFNNQCQRWFDEILLFCEKGWMAICSWASQLHLCKGCYDFMMQLIIPVWMLFH